MDVTFYKTATELDATSANQWYMISAPFDVNLNGGFFQTDGTPMVFTVAADPARSTCSNTTEANAPRPVRPVGNVRAVR